MAATEPVTEMMAAEAEEGAGVAPPAPADPAATNIPVARTDAELIDAVRTALTTGEAGLQACDRPIVTSVIDERDASNVRLVLLAVETGASDANADDDGEQMIVVLAPDGDPDACTELDRIALP